MPARRRRRSSPGTTAIEFRGGRRRAGCLPDNSLRDGLIPVVIITGYTYKVGMLQEATLERVSRRLIGMPESATRPTGSRGSSVGGSGTTFRDTPKSHG